MKEWDEIKQKYQDVWEIANQAVGGSRSGRVAPSPPRRGLWSEALSAMTAQKIQLIHATTGRGSF